MRTVIDYALTVDADWHAVPRDEVELPAWVTDIAALAPSEGPARAMLHAQLTAVSSTARQRFGDRATVALWVPQPASGYVGALLAVTAWDVGAGGWTGPAAAAWPSDDDVAFQQHWTGEVPSGRYAARHAVELTGDSEPQQEAVESVQCMVFPPDCAQFLHLSFIAESVSSFDDMPARVLPVVRSLQVRFGGDA